MSLKRVCDFCGTDIDGSIRQYQDSRPHGMNNIEGLNNDIDEVNEFRKPSINNCYSLIVQFTLLPFPSMEIDVCQDCCLERVIKYVEKLSNRVVTLEKRKDI